MRVCHAAFLLLTCCAASDDDVSLLQTSSTKDWDLKGAMADLPGGAYFQVMDPVMEAVNFAYKASDGPDHDEEYEEMKHLKTQFHGAERWTRVSDIELNPEGAGVHAFSFADSITDKMIIAFRGSCQSHGAPSGSQGKERELLATDKYSSQCAADACFQLRYKAFGEHSENAFGSEDFNKCNSFKKEELDYIHQARELVHKAQKQFPQRTILLTGHSLGGMLATLVAARQPSKLQALTFAPVAWYHALYDQEGLGLSDAEVERLESTAPGRRVALSDPYDAAISSMALGSARAGAMTCLYNDEENIEPVHCQGVAEMVSNAKLSADDMKTVMACRTSVHRWNRYLGFVRMTSASGAPLVTPKCRQAFSSNSEELRRALISKYRD